MSDAILEMINSMDNGNFDPENATNNTLEHDFDDEALEFHAFEATLELEF